MKEGNIMSRGIKVIMGLVLSVFVAVTLTDASELALRRTKGSLPLQSTLVQGVSIPNSPFEWQPRQLARPVKVAVAINGFNADSENARLLDAFFRLLEGSRDIEISMIYALTPDVNPNALADYLRHNIDHGSWTDVQISSGDNWIEINGNRIMFNRIASLNLLPWGSDALEAIVLFGNNPVDSGEIRGRAREEGPRVIMAGQTDFESLRLESDGTLSSEGLNLGRPLAVGVNTAEGVLSGKILSLIPSADANGLAIILRALASGLDLTAVNSIRIDTPADGVDTVTQPPVTTALLHSLIPQLRLLGSTELTIDRMNLSVPRGGRHVAITFSVDTPMSAAEINAVLQRLADGELQGLLGVADEADVLASCDFIEVDKGMVYTGPGFVLDSKATKVVAEDKVTGKGKIVMIHGWISDYGNARNLQNILIQLGLNDPDIGAVSPSESDVTPQGANLIAPSQPPVIEQRLAEPISLGINGGGGRIGKGILRLLVGNPNFDVRLINGVRDVKQLAAQILLDTAQGRLRADVEYGTDGFRQAGDGIAWISLNGKKIPVLNVRTGAIPWGEYGAEWVIEGTGNEELLTEKGVQATHIAGGAERVIVAAPPKDDSIPSFVPGVNDDTFAGKGFPAVVSNASCTSNNVSTTMKVIVNELAAWNAQRLPEEKITVMAVNMDTVHAITPTQNLMDNYGKKEDRMRAAQENAILSTSGAAKEVPKLIPELKGKMIVGSVRVGNQAGSVSALTIVLDKSSPWSAGQVNGLFRKWSEGPLEGILKVSDLGRYMTSGDIVGVRETAVIDPLMTRVEGNTIVVYTWYDNEIGFNAQVIENLIRMALATASP